MSTQQWWNNDYVGKTEDVIMLFGHGKRGCDIVLPDNLRNWISSNGGIMII